MCGETPGDDDRAVSVDLVGGLDYRGQSAKFIGLEENLLSLPPEGAEPKPLPVFLGPTGEDDVLQFIRTAVLPTQKQASHLSAASAPPDFIDPGLRRDRRRYARFAKKLLACGVLSFGF
jgi:hypothetical protein